MKFIDDFHTSMRKNRRQFLLSVASATGATFAIMHPSVQAIFSGLMRFFMPIGVVSSGPTIPSGPRPEIDVKAPSEFQTATFAMG